MAAPDPRDHVEVDHGTVAVVSDVGRHHHRNEDAFAVHVGEDDAAVLVVCDGVSSTVHPERASAAAAQAALDVLRAAATDLVAAHAAAQAAVVAVPAPPHADLGNPSCTFLGASWDPSAGVVRLGGLGDCRAYLVPDDPRHDAKVLTLDDSWAHETIAAGRDPELVAQDPMAEAITRWLGRDADPSWTPSLTEHVVTEPGHLVLCSDGLWKYVPEPAALRAVMPDGAPLTRAAGLVRVALDAGGQDNITVAVLRVRPATLSPTSQEPST